MAPELDLGPVDYFLVGFPPGAPLDGGALVQMAGLVQAGIIDILDALVIRKEEDGTISGLDLEESADSAAVVAFSGLRTGLIADEDMECSWEAAVSGWTTSSLPSRQRATTEELRDARTYQGSGPHRGRRRYRHGGERQRAQAAGAEVRRSGRRRRGAPAPGSSTRRW
jgi:hypothetical protein